MVLVLYIYHRTEIVILNEYESENNFGLSTRACIGEIPLQKITRQAQVNGTF